VRCQNNILIPYKVQKPCQTRCFCKWCAGLVTYLGLQLHASLKNDNNTLRGKRNKIHCAANQIIGTLAQRLLNIALHRISRNASVPQHQVSCSLRCLLLWLEIICMLLFVDSGFLTSSLEMSDAFHKSKFFYRYVALLYVDTEYISCWSAVLVLVPLEFCLSLGYLLTTNLKCATNQFFCIVLSN